MRAIDADELEELFREVIGRIAKRPDINFNMEHMIRASAMVIEMINDAPTVTPEPQWIPVTERLPDEEDSIFARYYGTDRWSKSMFRKKSREVIVTSVFKDGELHTEVAHTTDGEWHVGVNVVPRTVIAWMPLPEPMRLENK